MTGKELQLLDCKDVLNYKELEKKKIQNFILKNINFLRRNPKIEICLNSTDC